MTDDNLRKILLNPGPVTTTMSVKQAMIVPDICHREDELAQMVRTIQSDLKKIVNAGDDYSTVLFTGSGTAMMDVVINSVIPPRKKLAVVSNGTYGDRIIEIAHAYNIDCIPISFPFDQLPNVEEIAAVLRQNPDIVAVALVHHETSTGILNSLQEIGQMTKKIDRIFIVDAISSMGGANIDMHADGVDFLVSTANKCLQGMPGISFVIGANDHILRCKNNSRAYYFDLYAQYEYLQREGQFRFTPPIQILYALRQAITELLAEGVENRIARYHNNFEVLLAGLEHIGFQLMVPREYLSQLLAFVRYPLEKGLVNYIDLHDFLYARGYTIYPTKFPVENAMRFACIGDLNVNDIDSFLVMLEKALSS